MADDLFRFLQVRPARRIRAEQDVRVIRYPFFTNSRAGSGRSGRKREKTEEDRTGNRGSYGLVQELGKNPTQDDVDAAVASWQGRSRAEATLPQLQGLADAMSELEAGKSDGIPLLVERVSISLAYYAWDLLLLAYRERDPRRKEILTAAIRYLVALHSLGYPKKPPKPESFEPWFRCTVAVEPWFVPRVRRRPVRPSPLPRPSPPDTRHLQALSQARQELADALRAADGERAEGETGSSSIDEFAREVAKKTGLAVSQHADVVAVDSALATAQAAAQNALRPVPPSKNQIVVLGSKALPLDEICAPRADPDPCAVTESTPWPGTHRPLMPVGVGEMLVVRRQVDRYEMGLLADVESLQAGEDKRRTHRTLERSEAESEIRVATDTRREQEHQVEESEKLSLATRREQERQNQTKAGVELSGSYGTVRFSASASYATQSAKKVSDESAREYAKRTTEKAVERVREQRSERSLRRQLREVEETNVASLSAESGGPSIGIYRWVDRFDKVEMVNIGLRLIYEASIPEPAAFYIYSQIVDGARDAVVELPVAPHETGSVLGQALTGPQDLDDQNYVQWARLYGATGIGPPPPLLINISAGTNGSAPESTYRTESLRIVVPAEYAAQRAKGTLGFSQGGARYANLFVGNHRLPGDGTTWRTGEMSLDGLFGEVPITIQGNFDYFLAHVTITCVRSQVSFKAWQSATYEKILIAYQQRLAAAESEIERLRARGGVADIRGIHPEENRRIERAELKKWFLELLTGQRFESFDAMKSNVGALRYPEVDFDQAEQEGRILDFFERAFEWSEATYVFREYFTGRKKNWVTMINIQDPDPQFAEFLRAGKARYAVPVAPGFEAAVLHYVSTGEVFLGGDLPTVDDELYLSIAEELKARDSPPDDPVATWEVKVPTSVVIIDESGQLPSF